MTQVNDRLRQLYLQKEKINEEIAFLENKLKQEQTLKLKNKKLSKDEKIELFKALFINRTDIYAKKWHSKDGTKQGFFPPPNKNFQRK